ncbi:peptidylprolyl isomerase [Streptomyces xanthophaeus]
MRPVVPDAPAADPDEAAMPDTAPTTTSGARVPAAVRRAATAVAVAAAGAGLVWTAVSVTSGPADAKPSAACTYTPTGGARPAGLPAAGADGDSSRPYTARLVTGEGSVTFEALTAAAPCTTRSFAHLAGRKYFDGGSCHRLTTRGIFVLECGDPAGGAASGPGYSFPDENLAGASYPAGTVAVSKSAPGLNGGRFFISYADPALPMPADWTPFGRIVGGLDVLQRIAARGTADGSADGRPRQPVVLGRVTVSPGSGSGSG